MSPTVRKSISMTSEEEALAMQLAERRGFKNTFSGYIQRLIAEDAARSLAEEPTGYTQQHTRSPKPNPPGQAAPTARTSSRYTTTKNAGGTKPRK